MRQQSTVMGPDRPGPKIGCSADYRPVLSSERTSHFEIKKFSVQEKKMNNLVMGPKGGPDAIQTAPFRGP
jgi:hypothetical protein